MDHPHHGKRLLGLVGLEVPNQVPMNRALEIAELLLFPPEFLRIILTAFVDTAVEERPDPFRRALLGDGDQLHRIRRATDSPGRIDDPVLYCVNIVPDSFHVHEATFVSSFPPKKFAEFESKEGTHNYKARTDASNPGWTILKNRAS
jgi:hypothetical protein